MTQFLQSGTETGEDRTKDFSRRQLKGGKKYQKLGAEKT
jgi:hypothetical protein